MGFCCVCCELLYLALFLLHFPEYQAWPLVPMQAPAALRVGGEAALLCPSPCDATPHTVIAAQELVGRSLCIRIDLLRCCAASSLHTADPRQCLPYASEQVHGSGKMVRACAGSKRGGDQEGVPLALLVAVLALPGWALKQFINLMQLRTAAAQLAASDRVQDARMKRRTQDALARLAKMH